MSELQSGSKPGFYSGVYITAIFLIWIFGWGALSRGPAWAFRLNDLFRRDAHASSEPVFIGIVIVEFFILINILAVLLHLVVWALPSLRRRLRPSISTHIAAVGALVQCAMLSILLTFRF